MKRCICVCVIWTLVVGLVHGNLLLSGTYREEANETVLYQHWSKVQDRLKNGMQGLLKQILPTLIRFTSDIGLSEECDDSLRSFIFALSRFETWAFKILDASGKIASGYLSGTSSSLGSFDQCLAVSAQTTSGERSHPGARYCIVDIKTYLPPKPKYYTAYETLEGMRNFKSEIPLMEEIKNLAQFAYFMAYRSGVCVPASCTQKDVEELANAVADSIGMTSFVKCEEPEKDYQLDNLQTAVIAILSAFIVTALLCTIISEFFLEHSLPQNYVYQEKHSSSQGILHQLCSAFSITKNISGLVTVKETSPLSCLHGMKFLSLLWVITGHTYMLLPWQIVESLLTVFRTEISNPLMQPVVNAVFSVDAFLFITAVLVSYLTQSFVNRFGAKRFSAIGYILRRLFRLLPMTILGTALILLLPLFGSGPIWHETVDLAVDACKENWWISWLFFTNFLSVRDMCMPHLWYISVDFQFYVMALIFFMAWFWKKKAGIICGILMIILSWTLNFFLVYSHNTLPTIIIANPNPDKLAEVLSAIHFQPQAHAIVYVTGLLLGSFLADKPKISVPKVLQVVLWVVSLVSGTCAVYGSLFWNRGKIPEEAESLAYVALSKVAWTFSLSWIVLACSTGHGGVVNRILSWKALVPLSRLSFSTFVVHILIIFIYYGNQRASIMGTQLLVIWIVLGNIVMSFAVGFLLYIFFEAPFIQLQKLSLERLFLKNPNKVTGNGSTEKSSNNNESPDQAGEEVAVYRL